MAVSKIDNFAERITVETTADTTTSIAAGSVQEININVAKTGKKAVAICSVAPYYPNVIELHYFDLQQVQQNVKLYLKNTSGSALTGVSVTCTYI